MPITLCFALGFSIAGTAPSGILPILLNVNALGFGTDKAIPS